jgi:hypothetical protein
MSSRFVSLRNGQRDIHWVKLGVFAVLTFAVVSSVVEIACLLTTGRWSHPALLVAAFVSTLIIIRETLRAFAIPENELNADTSSTVAVP